MAHVDDLTKLLLVGAPTVRGEVTDLSEFARRVAEVYKPGLNDLSYDVDDGDMRMVAWTTPSGALHWELANRYAARTFPLPWCVMHRTFWHYFFLGLVVWPCKDAARVRSYYRYYGIDIDTANPNHPQLNPLRRA